MPESIDESVSVALLSNTHTHTVLPYSIQWRGRSYKIQNVGLHHTVREGRVLLHMFSVTDGNTSFRLQFNTETLGWRLLEVDS
jgi:hypothetical protein